MSSPQNSKSKFRATSKWQKFRKRFRENYKVDEITLKPLRKAWNLHHKDLDENNYQDLTKEENFACLNKTTHKLVHWIFPYYVKDPDVIKRLENLLEDMKALNFPNEDFVNARKRF